MNLFLRRLVVNFKNYMVCIYFVSKTILYLYRIVIFCIQIHKFH